MKKFKPAYTVDITNCNDERDVIVEFAKAKVSAGLPITKTEYNASVLSIAQKILDGVAVATKAAALFAETILNSVKNTEAEKKPNVFKRFWNWITRKK